MGCLKLDETYYQNPLKVAYKSEPKASREAKSELMWLSVDPIALYDPIDEVEHYLDGQHNGGYYNPRNMSVYGYTYQNPIIYIDPNGKQVDIVMKSKKEIDELTNNGTQKAKWDNVENLNNALQINVHGNSRQIANYEDGVKQALPIDGPISFNKRFQDNKEWQEGKNKEGFRVILYSCNVAKGEKSFAKRLSEAYPEIEIIAPSAKLASNSKIGKFIGVVNRDSSGKVDSDKPGYWFVFKAGELIRAYDGKSIPGVAKEGVQVDIKNIPKELYQ